MADLVIIYGTSWCGDCRRARALFDRHHIPYEWIDIDRNPEGRMFVEQTNRGYRSVPTIVFPDGSILVEPGEDEIRKKLDL